MCDYIIYSKLREAASDKNKDLKSREKAAKTLEISPMSLSNYETGITIPSPKVVSKMAELYDTPELKYYYCRNVCDMKAAFIPDVNTGSKQLEIEGLTLRLLKALKDIPDMKEKLIDIAGDGLISVEEKEPFRKILDELSVIIKHASELQVWAEKVIDL